MNTHRLEHSRRPSYGVLYVPSREVELMRELHRYRGQREVVAVDDIHLVFTEEELQRPVRDCLYVHRASLHIGNSKRSVTLWRLEDGECLVLCSANRRLVSWYPSRASHEALCLHSYDWVTQATG